MSRVAIQTGSPAIRVALRSRLEPRHHIVEDDADVIILDVPNDLDGLADLERLDHALALIVLADEPREGFLRRALGAGARAIISRDATSAELSVAIDAAELGLTLLGSDARSVLRETARTTTPSVTDLTEREREVLNLLSSGASNKVIAVKLHISDHTVKFHVGSILNKLGASTRAEAVTIGVRLGLIMI